MNYWNLLYILLPGSAHLVTLCRNDIFMLMLVFAVFHTQSGLEVLASCICHSHRSFTLLAASLQDI